MAKTAFEQKKYASEQQRLAAESLKGAGQRGIQALQAGRGQQLSAFRDQEQASRSLIQQQASQALGGALAGAPRTGMGARLGAAQSTTGATTRAMLGLEADIAGQRAAAAMGFGQQMAGAEAQAAGMEVQAAGLLDEAATFEQGREAEFGVVKQKVDEILSGYTGANSKGLNSRAVQLEGIAGTYSDPAVKSYLLGLAGALRQAAQDRSELMADRGFGEVVVFDARDYVRPAYAVGMGNS